MIDVERLRQIKERAARATKGPWRVGPHRGFGEEHDVEGPDGQELSGVRGMFYYRADAEFVAHAREDIPALVESLEDAHARSRQAADEGWLNRVPEPWASVLRIEIYSRSRKARRILDAATGDEEGYRRAREKVRAMGLDPDGVGHLDPDEREK